MGDADRLRAAADRLDALAVTHQTQTALAPTAALLRAVADDHKHTWPCACPSYAAALAVADSILGGAE